MPKALRDAPPRTLTSQFDPLGYDCRWGTEADGTLVTRGAAADRTMENAPGAIPHARRAASRTVACYSTVTDFARLRGLSMSRPRAFAV
ncbi:hypothetical protein [Streptomyces sp. NBC_00582]|uniref:hypothetical protein n=1 Tax=Streptomyces sp. NBC_00582 TaxID=2975783 RepID=UPI002E8041B1|nr:hypothetical protein [Streptomyces sp. NBC_00582]WUB64488.1 hypothetical protein OG852_30875 [Streptomyces sp. NBC_00582]